MGSWFRVVEWRGSEGLGRRSSAHMRVGTSKGGIPTRRGRQPVLWRLLARPSLRAAW